MTVSEDFISPENDQDLEVAPSYPVAFGIELNPRIQGILIAILGIVGAFVLFNYLVKPVQVTKQALEDTIAQKETQLQQQQASVENLEELRASLNRAIQQRVELYGLLGDPESLDTLLLDTNRLVKDSNSNLNRIIEDNLRALYVPNVLQQFGFNQGQIQQVLNEILTNPSLRSWYEAELYQFNPSEATIVQDESLGPELAGKLERQTISVGIQGLYGQTQAIIRNLERLEPLVLINNLQQQIAPLDSDISEEDVKGLFRPLNTTFTLEVLVPVGDPTVVPEPPPPPPEEGAAEDGTPAEGAAEDGAPAEG
ncbi:MAG: hypothetical protein HC873_09730 [Leptolyngbyaceae cyanobacterium SL_1_1]|nr:hypothetical protein [Leptolyngbyaceae cyanobacterium SL_1_1]